MVPPRRFDVQHLQGRQRDPEDRPAGALARRRGSGRPRRARSLREPARRDRRVLRRVRGGQLDPSGLVKGWAVDRGADILAAAGLRNFAINAGGDIRLAGGALPEREWRVGIEHPLEHDRVAAVVAIRDAALATSATYARGEHVFDPHTGRPPTGVLSVTITGPDLATADAYATAAFAMGAAGPAWTARLRGYEALTILADRRVLSTAGFPRANP